MAQVISIVAASGSHQLVYFLDFPSIIFLDQKKLEVVAKKLFDTLVASGSAVQV